MKLSVLTALLATASAATSPDAPIVTDECAKNGSREATIEAARNFVDIKKQLKTDETIQYETLLRNLERA